MTKDEERELRHLSEQRILVFKAQKKVLTEMMLAVDAEIGKEHRRYEAWGGTRPSWLIR